MIEHSLAEKILAARPTSVLICSDSADLANALANLIGDVPLTRLEPSQLLAIGTDQLFDLGLILPPVAMDSRLAAAVLSRMRDVLTQRLWIFTPETPWSADALIGFGMRHADDVVRGATTWQMYSFDLTDYKTTPDWFSAKDWAHPELYDKFRW